MYVVVIMIYGQECIDFWSQHPGREVQVYTNITQHWLHGSLFICRGPKLSSPVHHVWREDAEIIVHSTIGNESKLHIKICISLLVFYQLLIIDQLFGNISEWLIDWKVCCLLAGPDLWNRMLLKCSIIIKFTFLDVKSQVLSGKYYCGSISVSFPHLHCHLTTSGSSLKIVSHPKDKKLPWPLSAHPLPKRLLALGRRDFLFQDSFYFLLH